MLTGRFYTGVLATTMALFLATVAGQEPQPAAEVERLPFGEWMAALRAEARERGISEQIVEATLGFDEPLEVVVQRDRTQAEVVLTPEQYISQRVTRAFVRTARERAKAQAALLRQVEAKYDVPAKYLVAIWGMESNFGRFTGTRPVVQALATLAWDGRRATLFRNELFAALEILERGYIDAPRLTGSWAGAMGQPQFMPSSYLKFAADFDGDGRRDIWTDRADVFASIANYLKEFGWRGDQTWGREVRLPDDVSKVADVAKRDTGCRAVQQMTVALPLDEWRARGVGAASGDPLPKADLQASMVSTGKRAFLVYSNYEAILHYNCAHPYALSVALLADQVASPAPAAERQAPRTTPRARRRTQRG